MTFYPKTTLMGTHQHASKNPCTPASYCSNARLWKAIQQFINNDERDAFKALCQDKNNAQHAVQVILGSRLSNDPLLYSRTKTTVDPSLADKFGKLSVTDLNALEISLLQHRHDSFAYWIVLLLKRHATPSQCKLFLNHQFGKGGNTALHLAAFWGMARLVRLMLQLGADPSIKNHRQLQPVDCAVQTELLHLLSPPLTHTPSVLFKKAVQTLRCEDPSPLLLPALSPLHFSSSSDSSDSLDWSPPSSPSPPPPELSPFLAPSPPPALTALQKKKNQILHTSHYSPKVPLTTTTTTPLVLRTHPAPLQTPKRVHFDPQVILIDACVRGDTQEVLESLSLFESVRQLKDTQNRHLLHIALMHGHEQLVPILLQHVNINQPDQDGWTCLHYASALSLWSSFQILASLPDADLQAITFHGLKLEDCPNSDFGRRKCKGKSTPSFS
ncbi:hypothetical protein BY458DRAFT_528301 [Sporodiniella umbellata]|nr:hypothetical protein BY458DRAFT_528301 [Sporodiniella umbellata]